MQLTELTIKALKPKDKLYRVSDGDGLCLEIAPSGSKLWRWRYTFNGKAQMHAMGKYPAVSLAQARRLREEARSNLNAGKHPTREKKAQKLRAQHVNDNTFEKIARRWMTLKQANMNEKYRNQCIKRMEQYVFPSIGGLPISEVKVPDLCNLLENIAKSGKIETARRLGQLVSQTFRYAAQRGLCEYNPASNLRKFLPSAEEKHHACIKPSETPALLRAMAAYQGDALTKHAMHLLALTFVRTNELIAAQWSEINWEKRQWNIPKERMKKRREHMVPLSLQAIAILEELRKLTGNKTYIFYTSKSKSNHTSNGAVLMALRRMNYRGKMTGHGFRSLASTILNEQGFMPDVIEKQLAHADNDKVRSVYNRAEYILERTKMMQAYADYLDSCLIEQQPNVVPFKKTSDAGR